MFTWEDDANGVVNTILLSQVVFIQRSVPRRMYRVYTSDGNYVDIPWNLRQSFGEAVEKKFGEVEITAK